MQSPVTDTVVTHPISSSPSLSSLVHAHKLPYPSSACLSLTSCLPGGLRGAFAAPGWASQTEHCEQELSVIRNGSSFPVSPLAVPKHILQGISERPWMDRVPIAHSTAQPLTYHHWYFSLSCLIFSAPSSVLPDSTFQTDYPHLSPCLRVGFQEQASLYSLNMVELYSKCRQTTPTSCVLFHFILFPWRSPLRLQKH